MESLIYFLLWAGLLFAMFRFGCGAHVMGHGGHGRKDTTRGGDVRWVPPEKDIDPVCGMTVATATAKSAVHDGHVHYFCSPDCREKFEAEPAKYVKRESGSAATAKPMEHEHGSHH